MIREDSLTDKQIVRMARDNHLYLDAMACIHPSDTFLRDVGREVVLMLNASPVIGAVLDVEIGKVLYLQVNKS